jgi:hypothetical protein
MGILVRVLFLVGTPPLEVFVRVLVGVCDFERE